MLLTAYARGSSGSMQTALSAGLLISLAGLIVLCPQCRICSETRQNKFVCHGKARNRPPPPTFTDGGCQLTVVNESVDGLCQTGNRLATHVDIGAVEQALRDTVVASLACATKRRSTDGDD